MDLDNNATKDKTPEAMPEDPPSQAIKTVKDKTKIKQKIEEDKKKLMQ
jgi:hypothetical protein